MNRKYILIGCEESQAVCKAFREKGHYAYSCDLQESSGGHPEWHLKIDVFKAIEGGPLVTESGEMIFIAGWDMGIFFPTCTYLTVSANRWLKDQPQPKSGILVGEARREAQSNAVKFVVDLYNSGIEKLAIENPKGVLSTKFRKPDQIIHPWQFGHGEKKETHLWLKGLPLLNYTNIVKGREERVFRKIGPSKHRSKLRSKTYPGIAKAMADQWGSEIKIQKTLFDYE